MPSTDVAIIGAGPNGLALAAHLRATGVEHVVTGDLLSTWRDHMPQGMLLKSEGYGSDIAAPVPGFRVKDFCESIGAEYADRVSPVPRSTFVAYGEWFTRNFVPGVHRARICSLARGAHGFSLSSEDKGTLTARRVVVATGVVPFAFVPEPLLSLPRELASHTSAHSHLGPFRGRRVAVVGAGQSALETAALLNEEGAEVEVIARTRELFFNERLPERGGLGMALRRPMNPLCETVPCWAYYSFPGVFRAFPVGERVRRAREFLGPSGAWWLRERVEGRVNVRAGTTVTGATVAGPRARLALAGDHPGLADYDHVIAGTGFRLDLDRLSFLSSGLHRELRVAGGAPVLSRWFESSVPGLFFVGCMAGPSLGPSMRFLAGTHFTARRLGGRLSSGRRAKRRARHAAALHHGLSPDLSQGAEASAGPGGHVSRHACGAASTCSSALGLVPQPNPPGGKKNLRAAR